MESRASTVEKGDQSDPGRVPSAMTLRRLAIFLLLLASSRCAFGTTPSWALDMETHLKCGMSEQEVRAVAPRMYLDHGGEYPWLGRYSFQQNGADLWVQFKDGRLTSFVVSQENWFKLKTVRLSPRTDICSGALSFRLRIHLPQELPGARILVDGVQVGVVRWLQEDVPIPFGEHELRIERDGHRPIVRHLQISDRNKGDLVLSIDRTEV